MGSDFTPMVTNCVIWGKLFLFIVVTIITIILAFMILVVAIVHF